MKKTESSNQQIKQVLLQSLLYELQLRPQSIDYDLRQLKMVAEISNTIVLSSIKRSVEAQGTLRDIQSSKTLVRLMGKVLIDRIEREFEFTANGVIYKVPVNPYDMAILMEHMAQLVVDRIVEAQMKKELEEKLKDIKPLFKIEKIFR